MGRLNWILGIAIALVVAIPAVGQSKRQVVPFELYNGYLIVVKGSVGNLKNLSLVVDTGASHSVVDDRIVRKLRLKPVGSIEQLAANHVVAMSRVLLPELSWSGDTLTAFNALAFDLSPMSRHLGRRIDMVLGLDVLQHSSFQVDFESRRIHFGRNQQPENSVPFEPDVPYPVVEIHIDGRPVRLLVDTGSDSLAVLADRLPNASPLPRMEGRGRDLGGTVRFTRILAKQVFLGNIELRDAKVFLIPPMPESERFDGNLPPNMLGASKIYFDFERRRFGWDERKRPTDREELLRRMSAEANVQ
jgi:predicted aspartyl protease